MTHLHVTGAKKYALHKNGCIHIRGVLMAKVMTQDVDKISSGQPQKPDNKGSVQCAKTFFLFQEKEKQKHKCETVTKDENEPQDKKLKIEDKKHSQDRKFHFKKVKVETSTKESSVEDLKERVQMKIEKIMELKKDM